jgi:hypothetical protein
MSRLKNRFGATAPDVPASERPTEPPPQRRRQSAVDARESGVLEKSMRRQWEEAERFAPPRGDDRIEELLFRFEVGDYLGALSLSDALLGARPERLVPADVARRIGLDHREGMLFDQIDGASCLEDVLETTGLPMVDALRSLCSLVQKKVVALR